MNDNVFLKEQFNPDSGDIFRFKNIFAFMDFCYNNKLNKENSITYYDEEECYMYIKRI